MIGAIFATRTLLNSFDMNILIDATYRRKGYMSEALSTFISSVIPNGSELIFVVDKTNIASYHTVTKLPGIIEVPFTGKLKETMYRFSLTTEQSKQKAQGKLPCASLFIIIFYFFIFRLFI